MTREELDEIFKTYKLTAAEDGFLVPSGDALLTIHAAHSGASTSVSRVEAIKPTGQILFARNSKKELLAVGLASVFAVGIDAGSTAAARKPAGFG